MQQKYEKMLSPMLNKGHRVLHPRVVTLLENERNAKLFFRCYALGYIEEQVDEYGMRSYELTMPGHELKLIAAQEGSPSIFAVMHAFANVGQDIHNPQKFLVYDDVLRNVLRAEQQYRQDGELENLYQKQIDDGLVGLLRTQGQESMDEARRQTRDNAMSTTGMFWHPGQDRLDLADLAEMMYKEIMQGSKADF